MYYTLFLFKFIIEPASEVLILVSFVNVENMEISEGKLNKYLVILKTLGFKNCLPFLFQRLYSLEQFYFLNVNLRKPLKEINLRISYSLEKLQAGDWDVISQSLASVDIPTKRELLRRIFFYRAGFHNCYVLRNKNKEITSMLWIVYPSENDKLTKYFNSDLFKLKENEVLLENVFTMPKFRGFGFSPAITTELLSLAKEQGYKNASAIIYSMRDRITSLNDMMSIGFRVNKLVKEYRLFGFLWRKN